MKLILLAVVCTMNACAVVSASPIERESAQDLICGEDCDPGNFQYLMSEMVGATQGLSSMGPVYCHVNSRWDSVLGETFYWRECSGPYQDQSGQRYFADCVDDQWQPCTVRACGQYPQPSC